MVLSFDKKAKKLMYYVLRTYDFFSTLLLKLEKLKNILKLLLLLKMSTSEFRYRFLFRLLHDSKQSTWSGFGFKKFIRFLPLFRVFWDLKFLCSMKVNHFHRSVRKSLIQMES